MSRVTYEITAIIAADLAADYETYMRRDHIPALLATGCFSAARFSRGEGGRYLIGYEAADRAALERYLAQHAPRLREEFIARFPAGVTLTRATWDIVHEWP